MGGVTLLLSCIPFLCCTDEEGSLFRRMCGGLCGGDYGRRGTDNDPCSSAVKSQSYKFIYLLSADLSPGPARPQCISLSHC